MPDAPPRTTPYEPGSRTRGRSLTPAEQVSLHHPRGGSLYLSVGGFDHPALRKRGAYLDDLEGVPGCYFTPNAFRSGSDGRKRENVSRLTCLFVDVDDHSGGTVDTDTLLREACSRIVQAGLPLPTYYTETGRGLHLFWLFGESLPAERMSAIWQRVEREIVQVVGGDRGATDPNRFLRLSRTYNVNAGKVARSYLLTGERYAFQALADTLLPFTKEAAEAWKAEGRSPAPRSIGITRGKPNLKYGNHYRYLARFLDYIRASRGYEITLPEGQRHAFMWVYAACYRQTHGGSGYEHAYNLYSRLTNLSPSEIAGRLTGVFDRDHAYRLSFDTVADRVNVTPEELAGFLEAETETRRANDRTRKELERREADRLTRPEYIGTVRAREAEALHLHGQGVPVVEIARKQGVTTRTVRNYLRGAVAEITGIGHTPRTKTLVAELLFHPTRHHDVFRPPHVIDGVRSGLDHAPWLPSPPPRVA